MSTRQFNVQDDVSETRLLGSGTHSHRRSLWSTLVLLLVVCSLVASCTVEETAGSKPLIPGNNSNPTSTVPGVPTQTTTCALSTLHGGTSPDGTAFEHPDAVADDDGQIVIPVVEPVKDSTIDFDLTSFDDTRIRLHWFPHPDASTQDPKPTVLMGPGWSLGGDTTEEGLGLFGGVDIATLRDAGFNVLTWDPRGFGASTGSAQVNAMEFEARDVQLILNWLSTQDQVQLDDIGDPRVGMVGVSYGGGIQLAVAIQDCRVDALVPSLAWNSLPRSLYQSELMKSGWAGVLVTTAIMGSIDDHIIDSYREGRIRGVLSDTNNEWFASRGPGELVAQVATPTLLIQGTTDTLFTLNEGIANFKLLSANDTPVAMMWFCGGHGICLTNEDDANRIAEATIAWLDHYLYNNDNSRVDWTLNIVDQHGTAYLSNKADFFLDHKSAPLGSWSDDGGELTLQRNGGSGPTKAEPPAKDLLFPIVQIITPSPAENALEVTLPMDDIDNEFFDDEGALLLGTPTLQLQYRGELDAHADDATFDPTRPSHVFAQLVDPTTGLVVGNQITPIPLQLDGETHEVTIVLEAIAHHVTRSDSLLLQLVTNTVAYADPRLSGELTVSRVELNIPIAEGFIRQ